MIWSLAFLIWSIALLLAGAFACVRAFQAHLADQEKDADKRALYAATGGFASNDVHKEFHFARACEKNYMQLAVSVFLSDVLDAAPQQIAVLGAEHENFLRKLSKRRMDCPLLGESVIDRHLARPDKTPAFNRMLQMARVRDVLREGAGLRGMQDYDLLLRGEEDRLVPVRPMRWIQEPLRIQEPGMIER